MASFRYRAIAPGGEAVRGVMEAASEAEVIAHLQRQGRIPMHAEPERPGGALGDLLHLELGRGSALSRQEVTNLTRELSLMLGAGQDLDRALRFLIETAPRARVGRVLRAVRKAVRNGRALSAALAEEPRSFPRLYIGLVRAGEAGGTLPATLTRLVELMERQRALVSTVTSAMVYPALLVIAAIGSVWLLLTQVLPQFVPLFAESGAALPPSTEFLIAAGHFAATGGPSAAAGLVLAGLAARRALRRPGPGLTADRLLLRLPVIGTLLREFEAARLCRALGTLVQNGVPLLEALAIAREAVGNRAVVQAIEAAALHAKGGAGLAESLADAGVLPAHTIHLLRLGEETSQLGAMALRASEIHEERTRLSVERLVALLVPAITVLMGALIAGIVSSLLLAMLSLNNLAH